MTDDDVRGTSVTVAEWLACDDSMRMLRAVRGRVSHRKATLFACACCERLSAWLTPECRELVARIERQADDPTQPDVDGEECELAFESAQSSAPGPVRGAFDALMEALFEVWNNDQGIEPADADEPAWRAERAAQAGLVREILGDLSRPVAFDQGWLIPDVAALAGAIYDGRDFGRMHELAEALERAGCSSDDVLAHCRGPGPHVRGCWLLDRLLGKP
jgi:hypothetical protein